MVNEIASLQKELAQVDAKQKMDMLTKQSMEYLKAVLYNRYSGKAARPRFAMDAIWKQPLEILKEYPIILSTTFSSQSCLKDATYDYLIMDEASQVDLATGALALASAKNAVIVGDLKQLPNVIPEDQRERIFNKFYQADASRSGKGNGIGLAIVRRVAQLHSGTVSVDCRDGWTTFTVTLPGKEIL